jgi:hypothetical protein
VPTFLRAGHNGGGAPASPIVVTVTGNAGEQATLQFATSRQNASAQSVPTITGGGTWTKRGATAIVVAVASESVETWTNDGTAFSSLSIAFTNAPESVAVGVRLDSNVGAIGNSTTTTVAGATSFPISLVMQEAGNTLVGGWNGDDASTPDPYSAGASTTLRDVLAVSAASDSNYGDGDRVGGPGSITATLTVAAAACNVALSAVELRAAAGPVPDTLPKAQFPRNRLLFPAQPLGPTNPVVEMKWNDFGAGTAVPVNTPIGLDVASTFTPSLAESTTYGISIAAISSFVAALGRTAAYQRVLSIASGWTIALSRSAQYLRTLSVTGTWTPTIGRVAARVRTLAVSSTFTAAISRARALTLAVTSTFTANLARAVAYARSLSVSSTFTATLTRAAVDLRTLAVSSSFVSVLARQASRLRTLAVGSTMTATITKTRGYARSLAATAVFTPAIVIRYIVGKVLTVGPTFGASLAARMAWTRTLAAASPFAPTLSQSTGRRITLAVASVFNSVLQWILTVFGVDTAALTGKVRAYPRLSGVAAAYPRLAGKPAAYARLAGVAAAHVRLEGNAKALPRLTGEVRIYPMAA